MDPARHDYRRSLALHEAVAREILADPTILERARERVEAWLARDGRSSELLLRWRDVLTRSPREVAELLTDPSEDAAWLRSASPFAGVLDTRTRLTILRRVRHGDGES